MSHIPHSPLHPNVLSSQASFLPAQSDMELSQDQKEASSVSVTGTNPPNKQALEEPATAKRGLKFWMCIVSIVICSFLMALDLSGASTALPVIVHDLHGSQFEWIGSAYSLSATALMPLSGSLAQVFGRRVLMLAQIFLFAVGSAMCGAAPSLNFLIAGRTIQGVGAGGMNTLTQIVLSDLVPLKDRGKYNGFVALGFGFATATAPVIAGALTNRGQWRWFFYMNLPICAFAAILVLYSFDLRVPRKTLREKLESQDWIGNFLIIASTSAVVIALTWGGIQFSWGSAKVLVPLILGNVGLVAFVIYEAKVAKNPVVSLDCIRTLSGASGYLQSFIGTFYLLGVVYYLPVFFQACKDASPVASGVDLFGVAYSTVPLAIVSGISVTRTGWYRPQLYASFAFLMLGAGFLSTVHVNTSISRVMGFEALGGIGVGIIMVVTYYPVLAPLPLSLNTNAIGLYMFLRYLSQVWGVTVGGAVLQNELKKRLPADFLSQFPAGTAIAYSIIPVIPSLQEPFKSTVQAAFADSLKVFWQVLIGISALGLISCFFMKGLPLHTEMSEDWGLREGNDNAADSVEMSGSHRA